MGGVGVRRRVAAHCHLSAFQCSQTGLARCGHLHVQIGQAASALKNKNGNENENIDRNSCQIGSKSEKTKMKKIVKKMSKRYGREDNDSKKTEPKSYNEQYKK